MNRHQRRAAKAQNPAAKLERVVAIHEAGHAVARVLVAEDFGLPTDKMISYIEVGTRQNQGTSFFDKSVVLTSQAVTFGPMLSSDLQAVFSRSVAGVPKHNLTKEHVREAISQARHAGIDVDRWLRARMLISVLASAAEAKFVARPLHDVWNSYEAEADLKEAVADGLCAGLQPDEIEVFIDEALERAEVLVEEERIQRALEALADALPNVGRLPGHIAVEIINTALSD